ncbi:MAG: sigma factor-like helix-turn-helix DNA-binding protein [Erysipelotrichaceae bacterium]|nr:sigma factor-like helix-turn-helix DNA-binding protein [Erysipelotrichaceae bacterium]MDD3923655.1 sigma factor-like helix-turn-helix DNA-binding protein [Erysipelotrichaceae bacterium]MDD4642993.1 sigma factor-like helix-turn-helix DNA-binding protein [Erysipelotrichaceae bacterium]
MLVKNEYINQLLDWYDKLLTNRQIEIMNLYYREDLSLTEIAENLKISRSAVYDQLKNTERILKNYEDKLMLVETFKKRTKLYQELLEADRSQITEIINKLLELE